MQSFRQDQVLVQECLEGNEAAWSALIDKYKNLIFSIPIKRGISRDGAADIFQSVCLSLVSELPRLREARALAAWIIQTTSHRSLRLFEQSQRYVEIDLQAEKISDESAIVPEELVFELEREQMVREAVSELASDCRRLVDALFYQEPAASYEKIASDLSIPKGSIGPTRMRCLDKLKRFLEEKGFE